MNSPMTTPQTERELLDAAIAAHAETLKWSPNSFAGIDAARAFESASGKYVHHLIASQALTRPASPEYDRELIAEMLGDLADRGAYTGESVAEQIRLLNAADNATSQAQTVSRPAAPDAVRGLVERLLQRFQSLVDSTHGGLEGSWILWQHDTYKGIVEDIIFHNALAAPAVDGGECDALANMRIPYPNLPVAYNDCHCDCHRIPGVLHVAACCRPTPPADAEPVAVVGPGGYPNWLVSWLESPGYRTLPHGTKLYTTPPPAVDAICPNCERTTDIHHCQACGADFLAQQPGVSK